MYSFFQQVIQTFNELCGVGSRLPGLWNQLAGSSTTLISGNLNRLYITAGEGLDNGDLIYLYDAAGVLSAKKADATDNTKPCDGFLLSNCWYPYWAGWEKLSYIQEFFLESLYKELDIFYPLLQVSLLL